MRYVYLGLILLLFVGLFFVGKSGWLVDFESLQTQLEVFRGSVWAFPLVIGIFCVGAFIGAPQYALIFGAVTLLGPIQGGAAAWVATLCSGALTYFVGKMLGREVFQSMAGARAQKLAGTIAQNGFMGSLLVRLVPTAPFIVVNAAFAIGGVAFHKYMGGMALGIIPKIAIVTVAVQGANSAGSGNLTLAGICLALASLVFWGVFKFAKQHRSAKKPTI